MTNPIKNDFMSEFEQKLINVLPHGSGINGEWYAEWKLDENAIVMCNVYSAMDDMGVYCHDYDFSVYIPIRYVKFDDKMIFEIEKYNKNLGNVYTETEQECCGYGLGEYLEDIIYEALREFNND